MKTRTIALFLCALFLSTAFLGVGYAALTDTLSVQGTASAKPGAYVYISDAVATSGTATGITKSGTVLGSTVTLGNSASAQTILRVTVKNNTAYPYVFNGVTYTVGEDTYDNTAIAVSTSIAKGVEVAAGGTTEFDVIFKYKSGVSANKTLNSIINLSFVPPDEYIPEIAVKGAIGRFGEILNDTVSYNKLVDAMNNTGFTDRWSNSYIGNVAGATDADSRVVNELFTVDGKSLLTLDLKGDGTETHVTAMIKRENIGGTSADEMVIYMTGEEIKGNLLKHSDLQVFAVIYAKNDAGEWVQKGDLLEGTAKSNAYFASWNDNSFNTDTWKSTKAYNGVKSGSTIKQVLAGIPN